MTIQSMKIIDGHTNASSYSYSDRSGSYQSIDVKAGNSDAFKAIHALSTSQKIDRAWNGLSTGAKIGILCGIFALLAIGAIAFTFYCVSQRRRGKREKQLADEAWNAEQSELAQYRARMKLGQVSLPLVLARLDAVDFCACSVQFAVSHMGHVSCDRAYWKSDDVS